MKASYVVTCICREGHLDRCLPPPSPNLGPRGGIAVAIGVCGCVSHMRVCICMYVYACVGFFVTTRSLIRSR